MHSLPGSVRALGAALLLLDTACRASGVAPDGTTAPSRPAPASVGSGETRESEKFGYSWTLPVDWEFVPAETFPHAPPVSSIDVYAAKKRNSERPAALLVVTDMIEVVPARARDYESLQEYGADVLRQSGARPVGTRRVQMLGHEFVEVTGALQNDAIAIRLGYAGRRRFEFRCLAASPDPQVSCDHAIASVRIVELPPEPRADAPRVLHLRDARFGIAFDAPDDSWLAIGPRIGGGGAQVVWIWAKSGRQIDVQALDLSIAAYHPDQNAVSAAMAAKFRADGATVVEKTAVLAGQPCRHLEINRADGATQDLFILITQHKNYSILVTQPSREPGFVERALAGFRLERD
jgi:hypothetical protein